MTDKTNKTQEMKKFKNLREKLSYIQSNLVVPKTENNSFGKYNYRTIDTVLKQAKALLKETNTAIFLSDEIQVICDRPYLVATATLIDTDTDEQIVSKGFAREALDKKGMDVAQMTGSSSTYARKYALCGLLAVEGETDIDAMDNSEDKKQSVELTYVSNEKFNELVELIDQGKTNKTIAQLENIYKTKNMALSAEQKTVLKDKGVQ